MERCIWSKLNKQQLGTYAEYFVKMEFTMYGFQVYGTEVDDRGIDFVTRFEERSFLEVQVKSIRKPGYIFLQKDKTPLAQNRYLALAILEEGKEPDLYLIPLKRWKKPDNFFVSRDYEGKKSKPEWGLQLSKKNVPLIEKWRFDQRIGSLSSES